MELSPALQNLRCKTVDHVYDVELELMDNPQYVRVTANLLEQREDDLTIIGMAMCGRLSRDRLNEVRDSYDQHLAQSTPEGSLGDWVFNAANF
jgi:hypothetical protein